MRDLLGRITAKSREVLRFAQDDSGVVIPNAVRDLLGRITAKSRETLRFLLRMTFFYLQTKDLHA
ncbi:hypothetical protein [Legionella maceachernii]|uniref:hypothetical protein n=1 Tax=Legionella maceachernii TaxID=466 RepID=UPI000999618B|nr:hypothetical protein [Legionella maceachernii]